MLQCCGGRSRFGVCEFGLDSCISIEHNPQYRTNSGAATAADLMAKAVLDQVAAETSRRQWVAGAGPPTGELDEQFAQAIFTEGAATVERSSAASLALAYPGLGRPHISSRTETDSAGPCESRAAIGEREIVIEFSCGEARRYGAYLPPTGWWGPLRHPNHPVTRRGVGVRPVGAWHRTS